MGNTFAVTVTTPIQVRQYQTIQTEYARHAALGDAANAVEETNAKLRVPMPKTATESDIQKERKAILNAKAGPSFLIVQIALATLVLCLLVYVFVPAKYAHGIALLILSVGIAVGIFLKK